jgi:hypothetical protein
MVGVEFDPLWKNSDQVETGCIPNYCQQQFVCVNCLSGTFSSAASQINL